MIVVHVDAASGYAAGEVVRLIAGHPRLRLGRIASRSHAGVPIGDVFPSLRTLGVRFVKQDDLDAAVGPSDAVVFGGETADAPDRVSAHLRAGARVVDLSSAFRSNRAAAYGLPEIHREAISAATLVANPGCYPTAALLALAPLIRLLGDRITHVTIDAKSGISGAGRRPREDSLFAEVHDSIRPYAVKGHRHVPEIREQLDVLGCVAAFAFVPHVVPLSRGMLATCYARVQGGVAPMAADLVDAAAESFAGSALVSVLSGEGLPDTRAVTRTARALIGIARLSDDLVVAACAIDNLGKGAAAQAVQNLNVMFGYPEELGLDALSGVA